MWGGSYMYITTLCIPLYYTVLWGAGCSWRLPPTPSARTQPGPRLLERGENALVNLDPAVLISNILFMK